MRFSLRFLLIFSSVISSTIYTMKHESINLGSQESKTSSSVISRKILPHDVYRLIMQKLLEHDLPYQLPPFAILSGIEISQKRKEFYELNQLSCNWNRLIFDDKPVYILEQKSKPSKHDLITLYDQENNRSTSLSFFDPKNNNHFIFDGPNEDSILLTSPTGNKIGAIIYLLKLENFLANNQNIRLTDLPKSIIHDHQTRCFALASRKFYAVSSKVRDAHRDWLSWYRYNDNLQQITLLKQKGLQESLQKIAFLINSTLIGLTTNGSLHIYWIDKNNEFKQAKQKIPYIVIDFAVDQKSKGIIAIALQKAKIEIALADIRQRDSKGRIKLKTLWPSELKKDVSTRKFTLYDQIVCHTGNPTNLTNEAPYVQKQPMHLLELFETKQLQKALCNPNPH